MRSKNFVKAAVLLISMLFLLGCFAATGFAEEKIVVGGKNFTEQYILPELAKLLLEKAGFEVDMQTGVGTSVARRSLENDQMDLYYEYTGTAYTVFYKEKDLEVMTDPQKVYEWVKKKDTQKDLVWLKPVAFNNTYTMLMREEQAKKLGIESIGDLSDYINEHPDELVVGVNAEFWERPDGLKALMTHYGFRLPYNKVRKMDSGLVYKALRDKNVDVSMGFATDGRIDAFGFFILDDDKNFFPVYNPAPVVRKEVLEKNPKVEEVLNSLADKLTTKEMQKLNAAVDVEHKKVSTVAREWLEKNGLL